MRPKFFFLDVCCRKINSELAISELFQIFDRSSGEISKFSKTEIFVLAPPSTPGGVHRWIITASHILPSEGVLYNNFLKGLFFLAVW